MTIIDQRLARKGKGQPRQAVLQQARVLEKHAEENQLALSEHGWDSSDTARFVTNIKNLETALEGRAESASDAEVATKSEQAAHDAVKAYLRRLRLALPRVLRANPNAGVTMDAFAVDDQLRRSTPRTIAYLLKIRAAVLTLDEPLKKHFGGQKASDELDAVKAALEKADTDQEAAVASGPMETQALHEAMGRVLEDIEDLIRAGKSAFDGQATKAALFNKDLILRARGRKKAQPPAETTPPTPANP